MSKPEKRVLVDYYEGAYGPTLLIALHSLDDCLKLRAIFLGLADQTLLEVKLSETEFFRLQGVKDVILRITWGPSEDGKSLRRIDSAPGLPEFEWCNSQGGWRRCVGLLDGLSGPSHQYVTTEGVDDVLVQVSFMEDLTSRTGEKP